MQEENIYAQLAAFDFHGPVKVTVSFDDSDEDDFPQPQNLEVTSDNNVRSENFESTSKSSRPPVSNGGDNNESYGPLAIKTEPDPILIYSSDSEDYKTCSELSPIISYPPTKNSAITDRRENYSNGQSQKKNSEVPSIAEGTDHKIGLTCASEPRPDKSNIEPGSKENNEIMKKLLAEPMPNKIENKASEKSIDPIIMECYKKLLTSVSQNLIQIIDYHDSIEKEIVTKQLEPRESQLAWRKYNTKKNQLFSISYITVLNVILPQAKNRDFNTEFVKDTYNLIPVKKGEHYIKLCRLYNEILEWTRKKSNPNPSGSATQEQLHYNPVSEEQSRGKRKREADLQQQYYTPTTNSSQYNNAQMINNINAPLSQIDSMTRSLKEVQNSSVPYPYPTHKCNSNKCNQHIYSSGPPRNQINMNVDPAVLPQSQQRGKQVYPHPIHGHVPHTGRIPTIPNTNLQSYPTQMYQSEHRNDGRTYPPWTNIPPNQFTNNTNLTETQPIYFQQPPPPYSSHQLQWHPENPAYVEHPVQIPGNMLPPNIEKPVYLQQSVPPGAEPVDQPAAIENTRSMSTDSGFISPANLSSSTTPGPTNDADGSMQANLSPLITHVTSLNPNATLLPQGSCNVCKSTTHKKCLGCVKVYYCSLECQKSEWPRHMPICKMDALSN